jgi:hypothetical protein
MSFENWWHDQKLTVVDDEFHAEMLCKIVGGAGWLKSCRGRKYL